MNKRVFLLISPLVLLLFVAFTNLQTKETNQDLDQRVKLTLRDLGNRLLLTNKDSLSLVLPVKKVKHNHYKLEFQNKLAITPDSLVAIANSSLKKAQLPKRFIVEVINCNSNEVSYSFKISTFSEKDIVPCMGRILPSDCYSIHVFFLEKSNSVPPYLIAGLSAILLGLGFYFYKKRDTQTSTLKETTYIKIGNYKFYQDQNKLIRDATEIQLSAKECELMQMFSTHQNQVLKRETLIKHIWEDNGVFVGRSLDTFISKLRKKFKDDDSINIINVHGVGYKLEVK